MRTVDSLVGFALRDTLEVAAVGIATIPVLAFIGPRILQNDAAAARVRIGLGYRTRNHMGSMYLGVLCAGADIVSGIPALRLMRERRQLLAPSFKDLHAEFLRRVERDVIFENLDLDAISSAFDKTVRTGSRVNLLVRSVAYLADTGAAEPVARFSATLSMRYRPDAKLPLLQRLLARL